MEVYGLLASGYGDWPTIKQIAWLLGQVMNGIFNVLSKIGIENIGVCIIIFTIIIYTLMIPLTIKQQKFSKMSAVMQPEIKKIQKKYEGKKDQASMMKQQEEINLVYEKYGTSMTGGCLPMLIQMPILFALYPVIRDIPTYVKGVKDVYMPVTEAIMNTNGFQKIMETIGEASPVLMNPKAYDYSQADTIVNVLYKFQDSTWNTLVDKMPSIETVVDATTKTMGHLNNFLGINIANSPSFMISDAWNAEGGPQILLIIAALLIPLLSAFTQWLNVKLMPQQAQQDDKNVSDQQASMQQSMKMMNNFMPIMSAVFCFTLPSGMGLYWIVGAVVRPIQQVLINKHIDKMDIDEVIKKNEEKQKKKLIKAGIDPNTVNKNATMNTRNVAAPSQKTSMASRANANTNHLSQEEKDEAVKKSTEYYNKNNAKPGSLASKANMVKQYNEKNNS